VKLKYESIRARPPRATCWRREGQGDRQGEVHPRAGAGGLLLPRHGAITLQIADHYYAEGDLQRSLARYRPCWRRSRTTRRCC